MQRKSHSLTGRFRTFSSKRKIGELSEQFMKIYDLETPTFSASLRHEAVHVMTGLGIGVADELRIAALETGLRDGRWGEQTLSEAYKNEENLYDALMEWIHQDGYLNATENGLDAKRFKTLQGTTERLKPQEVKKFYELGLEVKKQIKRVTGQNFINMHVKDLAALDFSKVDFITKAHAIKNKYQTPRNRKIAEKCATLLFCAASQRRQHRGRDIPAAGTPWHGPLKKFVKAGLR